tara:strand:+ start:129 stop:1181 length:1053 start_codon:yes stop_codon:yes gene_type:complete
LNRLEKKLAKYHNKKYCLLTGSGTTAMHLIFKTIKKKSDALFPAITCIQAVNAAIFANLKVKFTDVNSYNYTMNLYTLKNSLTKNTAIVVPTHTFGHDSEINKISNFCKKKKIFVLEDATQSMGGSINGKKLGSFGDASVISFGYSKILDCGGGGCVLTDNEILYNSILKYYDKIPNKTKNHQKLFNSYKKKYYSIQNKTKNRLEFCKKIFKIQSFYKKLFIFRIDEKTKRKISLKINKIKTITKKRSKNHLLYSKKLKNITFPKFKKKAVSWRFTFLAENRRDDLIRYLRNKNIDVSAWYPSLHYINNKNNKNFKNSIEIEKRIVNLWTHENISRKKIMKEISIINNFS